MKLNIIEQSLAIYLSRQNNFINFLTLWMNKMTIVLTVVLLTILTRSSDTTV